MIQGFHNVFCFWLNQYKFEYQLHHFCICYPSLCFKAIAWTFQSHVKDKAVLCSPFVVIKKIYLYNLTNEIIILKLLCV